MKTQVAPEISPSVKTNSEKMIYNRRHHLYPLLAAVAGLGLTVAGTSYMNTPQEVGTITTQLVPNPEGDISTIRDAVNEITDNDNVANIVYEGQSIRKEAHAAESDSPIVEVTVYENRWPLNAKRTWVEAEPASSDDN